MSPNLIFGYATSVLHYVHLTQLTKSLMSIQIASGGHGGIDKDVARNPEYDKDEAVILEVMSMTLN